MASADPTLGPSAAGVGGGTASTLPSSIGPRKVSKRSHDKLTTAQRNISDSLDIAQSSLNNYNVFGFTETIIIILITIVLIAVLWLTVTKVIKLVDFEVGMEYGLITGAVAGLLVGWWYGSKRVEFVAHAIASTIPAVKKQQIDMLSS